MKKSQMSDSQILERAAEILQSQYKSASAFTSSESVKTFLRAKLSNKKSEVFSVMFLNSAHELIEYREMFFGTIDAASVYPREVVRACIETNAAAVILSHNHPSGCTSPSVADKRITEKLQTILGIIDTRVLDHIIVGHDAYSFADHCDL